MIVIWWLRIDPLGWSFYADFHQGINYGYVVCMYMYCTYNTYNCCSVCCHICTYITLNKHASYETNYILQSTSYGSISNVIWRRKALKVWHPSPNPKPRIEKKKISVLLLTAYKHLLIPGPFVVFIVAKYDWIDDHQEQTNKNVAEMGDYHSIVGLWMVLW